MWDGDGRGEDEVRFPVPGARLQQIEGVLAAMNEIRGKETLLRTRDSMSTAGSQEERDKGQVKAEDSEYGTFGSSTQSSDSRDIKEPERLTFDSLWPLQTSVDFLLSPAEAQGKQVKMAKTTEEAPNLSDPGETWVA